MFNHFNIFTPNHFAFMFSGLKMLTHKTFIHDATALTNDIIIWFKIICHCYTMWL
jgi:hypothetical protein